MSDQQRAGDLVEKVRSEASELAAASADNIAMRSCWNCNGAHEHLRNAEYIIWCFDCGHYFYKGVDITQEDDADA